MVEARFETGFDCAGEKGFRNPAATGSRFVSILAVETNLTIARTCKHSGSYVIDTE